MRVTFDFAAGKIAIDGDGPELLKLLEAARNVAPSISEIQVSMNREPQVQPAPSQSAVGAANPTSHAGLTLRQFVRPLRLDNAAERVAAIAFYKKTHEGVDTFSPREMDGWFTQAGLQKPSQMPVAVFDAKRKYGYLESGGHGKWRLTNNGENLVNGKLHQPTEAT